MLKYLWMVTQDLFLAVTFTALIHAVLRARFGREILRIHWMGIGIGVTASIVLAIVKNTTNKIVSSRWNHKIYIVIIVFSLLFLICSLLFMRKEQSGKSAGAIFTAAAGAGLSAIWIFYALPGCIAYPFIFNTMGNGYWSWFYFQRLLGWLLAFLIMIIYAHLLDQCAFQIRKRFLPRFVLLTGIMVNAFYCFCRFFVPFVNRAKWLNWPVRFDKEKHAWAAGLVRISSRYSMLFIWIVAVLVLILLVSYYLENLHVQDPYDNPAQLRKLRARNRTHRRQAAGLLVFLAAAAVNMTVIKAYDTREIALSEPETFTVQEDRILVPMDSVNDGHLHRFEYRTEHDVNVRWIVVKKPGSASFGVGLDACEVCGNAGYYERNGQVICKRCDVVMNINTIGFKGGCNPIPLMYEVADGNLVFSIQNLVAGEKEFK